MNISEEKHRFCEFGSLFVSVAQCQVVHVCTASKLAHEYCRQEKNVNSMSSRDRVALSLHVLIVCVIQAIYCQSDSVVVGCGIDLSKTAVGFDLVPDGKPF